MKKAEIGFWVCTALSLLNVTLLFAMMVVPHTNGLRTLLLLNSLVCGIGATSMYLQAMWDHRP